MPLSVTCSCGARLEIDEKFLGKEIACPDCQRPLPTKPPSTPPPLDLPNHRRVSGLAVLSLTLALIGAFTLVGTIAAILVGVIAQREIARRPNELDGSGFARAGVIAGGLLTILTLVGLVSPTLFGLDVFLRELAFVGRIDYKAKDFFESASGHDDNVTFIRLSEEWGKYISPINQSQNVQPDLLIIVNVVEDAYIACQNYGVDGGAPEGEDRKKKVLERFYKSELVNLLGRLRGQPLNREGVIVEEKPVPGINEQDIILDLRLGRIDRRFLIRYSTTGLQPLKIVVAAARKSSFDSQLESFRKVFDTVKIK